MVYNSKIIFSDTVEPNTSYQTLSFTNGLMVLFSTDLPSNQAVEVECYYTLRFEDIEKDLQLPNERWINQLDLTSTLFNVPITDSEYINYIPREYSDSGFPMYLRFNIGTDIEPFNLSIRLFNSDCSIEEACTKLNAIQAQQLIQTGLLSANAVSNAVTREQLSATNAGLAILATGLIPVTGGISATAVPIFTGASLPALLPVI